MEEEIATAQKDNLNTSDLKKPKTHTVVLGSLVIIISVGLICLKTYYTNSTSNNETTELQNTLSNKTLENSEKASQDNGKASQEYDKVISVNWDDVTWEKFESQNTNLTMDYPSFLIPYDAYTVVSGEDLPEVEFLIKHPGFHRADGVRPLPFVRSKLFHLSKLVTFTYPLRYDPNIQITSRCTRLQLIRYLIDTQYQGEEYKHIVSEIEGFDGTLEFTYFVKNGKEYVLEVKDNQKGFAKTYVKLDLTPEEITETLIKITESIKMMD